jgi:plastocyanin
MGRLMRATRIAALALVIGLLASACLRDGTGEMAGEPRAGYGNMGIDPPAPPVGTLLGPESFPCRPATGDEDYGRYGPGRMRRGGLEPEELERDHIVLQGKGVNFHGVGRAVDGGTIEMEMDEDYFGPTILKAPAGATVTIEIENEGSRPHNLSVPGQNIDLNCGVRARGEVTVVFPRSGVLLFTCRYGATSGMRGALAVQQ